MMKKYLVILLAGFTTFSLNAQDNVLPAKPNNGLIFIRNATVHTGTGQVLQNTTIQINKDKIEKLGTDIVIPADAKVYDASGKHVYPGLIMSNTNIGLRNRKPGKRFQ